MSPVFGPQSPANKLAPVQGDKLSDLIGGVSLEDVGRYNWGTADHAAINRALVELVGCEMVDETDPGQSELDPALGTGGSIYLPKPWKAEKSLEANKKHTFKLKKRLPMPAVAITELTQWFIPEAETCTIKYRLEGVDARANKTDVEVHVAQYIDEEGETRSSYYKIKKVPLKGEGTTMGPDNPVERNEVRCGTDGDTDTHVWTKHADNVAPSAEVTESWSGESTAKQGVLKPAGTDKAYINSSCAPYSVMVRYYKSDDDKTARITFDESFYPRWELDDSGDWELDPTSLVVKWTIKHGTKEKLVHGQLLVFDKDDDLVVRVALDKAKLDAGELDLEPIWDEVDIDRDMMPYRVQIQAHSGPDEADGLAIAVMPTQVRAYRYDHVQFLAFNCKPPSPYKGNANHDLDIAARCKAMIEAVQTVSTQSDASKNVLKIFMAPEFYFRGPEGAYPVEKIETIMPQLRDEADKIEYADWMFVFGSAIGYQKHQDVDTGTEIVHKPAVHEILLTQEADKYLVRVKPRIKADMVIPLKGWRVVQGNITLEITKVTEVKKHEEYVLKLAHRKTFTAGNAEIEVPAMDIINTKKQPMSLIVTDLLVKGPICERIPATTVGGVLWKVKQGMLESEITASTPNGTTRDEFWLTLKTPAAFSDRRRITLIEPMATEVTNVALVQKGYPSPRMGDGGLRHVAIYKEKVSPIDFHKTTTDWHRADASHRLITIHGTPDRAVLPTMGSVDLAGGAQNTKRSSQGLGTAGSEINKTGVGGGVVFTMDDITFGLEVCLDHGANRLFNFYDGPNLESGDPAVQVHLIPSWGMSIGEGKICCPEPDGTVFNVDGSRVESAARVYDGTWSCNLHPNETGNCGDTCTLDRLYYYCSTCRMNVSDQPGSCSFGHPAVVLTAWKKCGAPKWYACPMGCSGQAAPCGHPGCTGMHICASCGAWRRAGTNCGCADPQPKEALCDRGYYSGPACACGFSDTRCNHTFQKLGTALVPLAAAVDVPSANAQYFTRPGWVLAYAPVAIPDPSIYT